jgi:prepilin-type processing-associated H-X9-DG protein
VCEAGLAAKMAERLYDFPPPAILAHVVALSISLFKYKILYGKKANTLFNDGHEHV